MLAENRITATVDPHSRRVDVTTASGYSVTLDDTPAIVGGAGPGPMEMVLGLLAACGAMDVASILTKKRQRAATYSIEVVGNRAPEHPKVYTHIRIEHRVSGEVEPEALRRSIELSATRYCPVNAMLSRSVTIEHRYHLERPDGGRHEGLVAITGPAGTQVT